MMRAIECLIVITGSAMVYLFYSEREWFPQLAPYLGIAALLAGVAWEALMLRSTGASKRILWEFVLVAAVYTVLPALILFLVPVAAYGGRHMGNIVGLMVVLPLHLVLCGLGLVVALILAARRKTAHLAPQPD